MKRWSLAILLAPVLGGCVGGSAASAPGSPGPPAQHGPRAMCVAAWNGPPNAAARALATPPWGPYPWYAHRPIRPQGGFEVFIAFFVTAGGPVGTHPVPCAVEFWFSRGYHARPALLSFTELHLRRGVFGRAAVNARRAMRFHPEGREYVEGSDGRLRPA
jgi:hypothetical protein